MSYKQFSEQQYRDIHDTIVVLLATCGNHEIDFDSRVADVFRRAYDAVRTERDPPLPLLPSHKGQKRLALPPGVRAMMQDQHLLPPKAPGLGNGN